MSLRTMVILLLLLVVLVAVAVFQSHQNQQTMRAGPQPGDLLLTDLDVNAIEGMEIRSSNSTVSIERKEGLWLVSSLYDYPADFPKLAGILRELADLTTGQVIRDGDMYPEEFDLGAASPAIHIDLFGKDRKTLTELTVGKQRMASNQERGYPTGRYLRAGGGPVVLVEDTLSGLSATSDAWIKSELLSVPSRDVEKISVTASNTAYTLRVKGGNNYELDPWGDDEEIDQGAVSRLLGALQNFRCHTVADPSVLWDEEEGFSHPSTFVLRSKEGFTYTVRIGEKTPDGASRYVRLSVSYDKPSAPTLEAIGKSLPPDIHPAEKEASENKVAEPAKSREEKVQEEYQKRMAAYEKTVAAHQQKATELQKSVEGWTYVIAEYTLDALQLPRDQIVKKKKETPATP